MNPNPRIHKPIARSFARSYWSVPTITQSTALWKAMRHREELERQREELEAAIAEQGLMARIRHLLGGLPLVGRRR